MKADESRDLQRPTETYRELQRPENFKKQLPNQNPLNHLMRVSPTPTITQSIAVTILVFMPLTSLLAYKPDLLP